MPDHFDKLQAIFLQAVEMTDSAARQAWLNLACANDDELRLRIESLLAADKSPHTLLNSPAPFAGGDATPLIAEATPGTVIAGRYKLLEQIGEGGMGLVWMAEQRTPVRRLVALKLIKAGMDSRTVLTRFEAERQALAMMDHPSIARVFDGGTTDQGHPWFAMELVRGLPVTEYCDQRRMPVAERLALFMQVCSAVQHAHQKGIIHRDLKPSNVLVTEHDGQPVPKVIDFGLAKALGGSTVLTEHTLYTQFGAAAGTPLYMAPEQVAINALDIDTRADVYALGVLLYELLTGATPLDRQRVKDAAWDEIRRVIREEEPLKPSMRISSSAALPTLAATRHTEPSKLIGLVRGDLDWIVLKALEKDRNRRYETASSFAADVGRHLANEPVNAAPPSLAYRTKKFYRKYRRPLVAAATIAGILVASIVTVSILALQLKEKVSETRAALAEAEAARSSEAHHREAADAAARQSKYESFRNQAQYLIEQKLLDKALIAAKEAYVMHGGWEDGLLINRIVNQCRGTWDIRRSISVENAITSATLHTKRGDVLLVSVPKQIRLYEISTGKLLKQLALPQTVTRLLAMGPKPQHVLAVGSTVAFTISVEDLSLLAQKEFAPQRICGMAANESTIVLALSNDAIQLYSPEWSLVEERSFPNEADRVPGQELHKVAISPDSDTVVVGGRTFHKECMVWNRKSSQTRLYVFNGQTLQFLDNATLVAFAMDQVGGNRSTRYSIDQEKISRMSEHGVPVDDVGREIIGAWATQNESFIAGPLGIGIVRTGGYRYDIQPGLPHTERYSSLLGLPSPDLRFSSLSSDASILVLANLQTLIVFSRKAPSYPSYGNNVEPNASLGPSGYYKVFQSPESITLQVVQHNPFGWSTSRYQLPAVPLIDQKYRVFACGIAVSDDQRVLAVRTEETEGWGLMAQRSKNHSVAVYHDLDPQTGQPQSGRITLIRLREQDQRAHFAARVGNNRILILSRSGDRLLIGCKDEFVSTAELYDTDSGRLVRQWTTGSPLGGQLREIPGHDMFADIDPKRRSVRLCSLTSGESLRSIDFNDPIRGFCPSSDGSAIVVSLQSQTIRHCNLTDGSITREFSSRLIPVSWSSKNDVFAAFDPDEGKNYGSLVVADCKTGSTIVILARAIHASPGACFDVSGNVLLMHDSENDRGSEIVRSMSPKMADQWLLSGIERHATVDATGNAHWKVAESVTLTQPEVTADEIQLRQKLGQSVALEAAVADVLPTQDGRALNLLLTPKDSGVLLWIDAKSKPKFDAQYNGSVADAVLSKRVYVRGVLGEYGGRSSRWKNRLQITVTELNQLKILDDGSGQATPQQPVGQTAPDKPKSHD